MSKSKDKEAPVPLPSGLRGYRFSWGGEELAVLSYSLKFVALPRLLSAAERQVAIAIIQGRSNRAIARERRTSTGTVAKQVASLFKKAGVHSRADLIAAACHTKPD